ncbi:MAG: NADPH-dependent FMN reductase [Eggerthellaceae bacterium]
MKLLAIAGSLRENSYNRQLAEAAGALMREKHRGRIRHSPLGRRAVHEPGYRASRPEAVTRARGRSRADGLWLFSPEYNHAIPGPLKNLLDWLSRP